MISYISGIYTENDENGVIIECGGVGFYIRVPATVFEQLPEKNTELKLYTYFHVKEDAMQLYGFFSRDELNMFEKMLGVNGIGPKGALAILSSMTIDTLRFAIYAQDAKTIAKAPGVGLKTAQKMILELKDKIPVQEAVAGSVPESKAPSSEAASARAEASEALVALGYSNSEAFRAVSAVKNSEELTVEEIIKAALKQMWR